MFDDTMAAVATAFGQGAIAVLRMSGPRALEIAATVWRGRPIRRPRVAEFGAIVDPATGREVDRVLLTFFRGPASYTGEDLVEISCHGGLLVTREILQLLLKNGARAAEPGEFTQRAFLNGKMDLTQAEAVMDLISAQTTLALRAANEQLAGRLGQKILSLREALVESLAHVEAFIDFPEEGIDPDSDAALRARIEGVRGEVQALLATADQGRILREGVRTVIAGPPNVGKSSLLNRLLGFERAIVSDVAGTTRDTLEETVNLQGLPLRLIDTAGLREHDADRLEQAGMERTRKALAEADLVLEVADGHAPRSSQPRLDPGGSKARRILLLNKADLGVDASWKEEPAAVWLSCATGEGVDRLAERIFSTLGGEGAQWGADLVAINARHQACLAKALPGLDAALALLAQAQPPELIAFELRESIEAVGDVVGRLDTEELLGVIFSRFCIGK